MTSSELVLTHSSSSRRCCLKLQTLLILFSNLNIAFQKILNFKILLHTHRFENVDRRRVLNMTAVRASASDLVLTEC
jgi:hypothetical protein